MTTSSESYTFETSGQTELHLPHSRKVIVIAASLGILFAVVALLLYLHLLFGHYRERWQSRNESGTEEVQLTEEQRRELLRKVLAFSTFQSAAENAAIITSSPTSSDMEQGLKAHSQQHLQVVNDSDIQQDETVCAICLGPIQEGESVVRSQNCQHTFHNECGMDWFLKKNECPFCRVAICEERKLHQITEEVLKANPPFKPKDSN